MSSSHFISVRVCMALLSCLLEWVLNKVQQCFKLTWSTHTVERRKCLSKISTHMHLHMTTKVTNAKRSHAESLNAHRKTTFGNKGQQANKFAWVNACANVLHFIAVRSFVHILISNAELHSSLSASCRQEPKNTWLKSPKDYRQHFRLLKKILKAS